MKKILFVTACWLVLALGAHAVTDDDLLEPDQAFRFSAALKDADTVTVEWNVADGYYLYRDKIRFSTDTPGVRLGAPVLPAAKIKQDEFFGETAVYRGVVKVDVPLKRDADAPASFTLKALSQGCADIGVCYPPHTQTAALDLPPAAAGASSPAKSADATGALAQLAENLGLADQGEEFLEPDQAFTFTAEVRDPQTVLARWEIADGYYLYRDKFKFVFKDAPGVAVASVDLPAGEIKDDEFFGRMEVYHREVQAVVRLSRDAGTAIPATLEVTYQGCAEAGICYPPIIRTAALDIPATDAATDAGAQRPPMPALGEEAPMVSEQDRLARMLTESALWLSLLIFFGLGIGLAFTPCVFPMIPILSSIIVGQGTQLTTGRAFMLSLVYVLAMALTYTVAGVIAALFGQNLQAAFQNPWILGSFAAVFVLLALSMFGFYELQMPSGLQSKLSELSNRQQGGTLVGVGIMGFLSALIVGPCVAAPLAGALIVIGQTGDAVLGGSALFALSLGMGAPLLVIGTSAGKILPKAGDWMNTIKAVFGVLLLAVAVWMLERVLPAYASMLLWAALFIISGIYMGALTQLDVDATGWRKFWKGMGVIAVIYGSLLMVGAATGRGDLTQPLGGMLAASGTTPATASTHVLPFKRIKGLDGLQAALADAQGKPVMLDFYADWCVSCKEMEKYTFATPEVQQALAGVELLQTDVTQNEDADKALLNHFGLFGPPAILFFGNDGRERRPYRIVGYMNAERFRAHIEEAIRQSD